MRGAYSDLKPLWHLERLKMLRETGRVVPPHMQLVISDLCNHDCSFCAYRMSGYPSNQNFAEDGTNNPNRMIPTAKANEILEDAAEMGVKAVQFTGGGEPTVHPDHLGIFDHALGLGLDCALVTNGALLRDGWQFVLPRFKWIRVSIDAGTPETYAEIRKVKPSMFDRVLEHTKILNEDASATGQPFVGLSFVVTPQNMDEIERFGEVAFSVGAKNVRYTAMFSTEGPGIYSDDDRGRIEESIRTVAIRYRRYFKVVDQFSGRMLDLESEGPDYSFCGYQHLNVYVGGDLNVYRCCNLAYNDRGYVGSLKEQTFKDFWNSEAKHERYTNFNARGCRRCAFNEKNRAIDYVMQKEDPHVNFV